MQVQPVTPTVRLSKRAVVARIRRALAKDGRSLARCRAGICTVVRADRIVLTGTIRDLATRLGILQPWESIA